MESRNDQLKLAGKLATEYGDEQARKLRRQANEARMFSKNILVIAGLSTVVLTALNLGLALAGQELSILTLTLSFVPGLIGLIVRTASLLTASNDESLATSMTKIADNGEKLANSVDNEGML